MSDDTSTPKVLVVDDDRGLSRLIQKSLQREGLSTAPAATGKEALDWLAGHTADLLLLDLHLPDMAGGDIVNRLAASGRSIPFIIITGQGDERVAVDMMKGGALDYVVKDARFIELVPTVVRRALQQLQRDRQLADTRAALEESRKHVLAISEREQRRFGAELHDGLGQQLTAIELLCSSLKADLPAARPDLEKQMAQITGFLREAVSQTRSLARSLCPVNLESGGLPQALAELAANMSQPGRVQCALICPPSLTVGDSQIAGHLYRIAQEAVNNAIKHAQATTVTISLVPEADTLRLEIRDDGTGFPKNSPVTRGMGLHVMKQRASVIGGKFDVKSENGRGVTVSCIVNPKLATP